MPMMQQPAWAYPTGQLMTPPNQAPMPPFPVPGQQMPMGQVGTYMTDENSDDDDDGEDEDIPEDIVNFDDLRGLTHGQADEAVFLQHRFAKRRWKKWFGGRRKGGFRRRHNKHYPAMLCAASLLLCCVAQFSVCVTYVLFCGSMVFWPPDAATS